MRGFGDHDAAVSAITMGEIRTHEVWFDTDDSHRAISRRVYDMTTGNVLEAWKPIQNAAGTVKTSFTYDSRKLFPATVINEAGHQVDQLYEYGTGTKLETAGPNVRTCTSNCPQGAEYPIKETQRIRIDGLGREIESYDTISDDGGQYRLYLTGTKGYIDTATSTVPTSVTTSRVIQYQAATATQQKTELDGHGRPTKQIVYVQGEVPNDQITTFSYRPDGTVQTVNTPDPTANNASTVAHTYTFDSLGRPLTVRRPDALAAVDQSGVSVSYDGVTKTVSEIVKAGDGQVAVTKTITDSFGRLIEVHEQTAASPVAWAITRYTFGPNDIVTRVVDPQGVTTDMTHDFAGHRTQIARHGRTWKYGYDKNSNIVSEQVPGSSGPSNDLAFTTTTAYDALDRPTSKVIGQRTLSAADQDAFGARTETFTWDAACCNKRGKLVSWKSFAPNASTPAVFDQYSYDALGNRIDTTETLNIAGYASLQRSVSNRFNFFGGITWTYYKDMVGGTNKTESNTIYDKRGLPKRINLSRTGEPTITIAEQTRNVAGLVTKRRTDTTGAMTFVESNWVYDKLGRVSSQVVQKGPGPVQVVAQALAYFGNDDPKTLAHSLGTSTKQFQFGYDLRHQIASANETTTGGYFTSSYTYGLAGRFTGANITQPTPPPGSELKPRNVTYQYGDPDPERITGLLNAGNGTKYASYTFDAAGNQTFRCYGAVVTPACGGESMDYVYDGNDQLRRATKRLNGVVQGSDEYWYTQGSRIAVVKRDASGAKTELAWYLGDTQGHYDQT